MNEAKAISVENVRGDVQLQFTLSGCWMHPAAKSTDVN